MQQSSTTTTTSHRHQERHLLNFETPKKVEKKTNETLGEESFYRQIPGKNTIILNSFVHSFMHSFTQII